MTQPEIAFGPVPSRRLGRSLGINNIPPKHCSYTCVYCQVGHTLRMQSERSVYFPVDDLIEAVGEKIRLAQANGEEIDYLTIVPDGEPTLDIHLGQIIEQLRTFRIPVAVITNASLIWREDVRQELFQADWVSVKVDAIYEGIWRKINRPHFGLRLSDILQGIFEFSRNFKGELCTETMLVRNLNDSDNHLGELADYLSRIKPAKSYLSIPTRPPAVWAIHPPDEAGINRAYQIFNGYLEHVEYLIGYEGNAFATTDDVKKDLLSITAVHPMREEAVKNMIARSGSSEEIIEQLIADQQWIRAEHMGNTYYMRRFNQLLRSW